MTRRKAVMVKASALLPEIICASGTEYINDILRGTRFALPAVRTRRVRTIELRRGRDGSYQARKADQEVRPT